MVANVREGRGHGLSPGGYRRSCAGLRRSSAGEPPVAGVPGLSGTHYPLKHEILRQRWRGARSSGRARELPAWISEADAHAVRCTDGDVQSAEEALIELGSAAAGAQGGQASAGYRSTVDKALLTDSAEGGGHWSPPGARTLRPAESTKSPQSAQWRPSSFAWREQRSLSTLRDTIKMLALRPPIGRRKAVMRASSKTTASRWWLPTT